MKLTPQQITVDDAFRALIDPPAEMERLQLEENITADGYIRDPLVVWQQSDGAYVLVDGHNRLDIALSLRFASVPVVVRNFDDRDAAAEWIDLNQYGRRNLSPAKMSEIRARIYERRRQRRGGQKPTEGICQSDTPAPVSTAAVVGKELGVSESTVYRDARKARERDNPKPPAPQPDRETHLADEPSAYSRDKVAARIRRSAEREFAACPAESLEWLCSIYRTISETSE